MPVSVVVLVACAAFALAFRFYARRIAATVRIDDARAVPAVEQADGVDFVPTSRAVLLAQHFAAIAAAGPIVGPVTAALAFGWAPAMVWIVVGAIFIGALHDFLSLVASVRHGASGVPELVGQYLGPRAKALMLAFIWLSLTYVIVAFTDVTARQFVAVEQWDGVAHPIGAGVATSSFMYLGLSVLMGIATTKFRMPLWLGTLVFLPALVGVIALGQAVPLVLPFDRVVLGWSVIILLYCALASVLPMWLLLQPRGYLGGYFLYVTLAMAVIGIAIGGFDAAYPAYIGFDAARVGELYPFLFVTIACGACSGFHGLVCSGTTSRQVSREGDMPAIGYGGMLLEGVVAVVAVATVMIWPLGASELNAPPGVVYARGIGHFAHEVLGISPQWGLTFGMLAFATFVYDTLDVATRLNRYLLEELFSLRGRAGRFGATALTLGVPILYLFFAPAEVNVGGRMVPSWQVIWTIFGSSNQLLAALTLLLLMAWLRQSGEKRLGFVAIPAAFMLVTTISALGMQLWRNGSAALGDNPSAAAAMNAVLALLLVLLAAAFTLQWFSAMRRRPPANA
jgi:carbon starvation protein